MELVKYIRKDLLQNYAENEARSATPFLVEGRRARGNKNACVLNERRVSPALPPGTRPKKLSREEAASPHIYTKANKPLSNVRERLT
jgi:hypothetical protein